MRDVRNDSCATSSVCAHANPLNCGCASIPCVLLRHVLFSFMLWNFFSSFSFLYWEAPRSTFVKDDMRRVRCTETRRGRTQIVRRFALALASSSAGNQLGSLMYRTRRSMQVSWHERGRTELAVLGSSLQGAILSPRRSVVLSPWTLRAVLPHCFLGGARSKRVRTARSLNRSLGPWHHSPCVCSTNTSVHGEELEPSTARFHMRGAPRREGLALSTGCTRPHCHRGRRRLIAASSTTIAAAISVWVDGRLMVSIFALGYATELAVPRRPPPHGFAWTGDVCSSRDVAFAVLNMAAAMEHRFPLGGRTCEARA